MVSLKTVSGISSCALCEVPEATLSLINVGLESFAVNRCIKL
jgi:hypothetical protein